MTETAPAGTLVGDEARALIGSVIGAASGTVLKKEFQRWAAAVGDRNPLYFDDELARAHGFREAVMPPLYLPCVTLGVVDLATVRADGMPLGAGTSSVIPLPRCRRWMAGGERTEYHEPLYDGDRVSSVRTVVDIAEKQGRSGAFVLITTRFDYHRGDGVLVAASTLTTIARP